MDERAPLHMQDINQDIDVAITTSTRLPAIRIFRGEKKDLKRFLAQLDQHFATSPERFQEDDQKVLCAASQMEGPPQRWSLVFIRDYLSIEHTRGSREPTERVSNSYDAFKEGLGLLFGMYGEKY